MAEGETRQIQANWNHTEVARERIRKSGYFEEKGLLRKERLFKGRPVIHRDTPINGGVYLGAGAREAIVVDDKKDLDTRGESNLDKAYQRLLEKLRKIKSEGKNIKGYFLEEVYKLVLEEMPYDLEKVERIQDQLDPDQKIYLSHFFDGGVCRHQALLAGYLLERLAKDGIAGGKVSIDRNSIEGKGGHAWVRYTNSIGKVFIIDVAQEYLGPLKDIAIPEDRWFYERPEDKEGYKKPTIFQKLVNRARKAFGT